MSLATGAEFPQANTAHANMAKLLHDHGVRQQRKRQEIKERIGTLASSVMTEYLERKPFRAAAADCPLFPSVELARALRA